MLIAGDARSNAVIAIAGERFKHIKWGVVIARSTLANLGIGVGSQQSKACDLTFGYLGGGVQRGGFLSGEHRGCHSSQLGPLGGSVEPDA